VITREMIRRSGLTSVPEILRLAPGVEVARVDGGLWSIGIRGFSNPYGNKLLVLMDGRSVYNDTISGVYWSAQDLPVEEIERIEIVRGPVAAIWGANAVNGVINIITLSAQDSEGGSVTAGFGGDMLGYGHASYSGRLGAHGNYRVYAGYRVHDALEGPSGTDEGNWIHRSAGFRMDWDLAKTDSLLVEGQGFTGNERDVLEFLSPFRYNPGPLTRQPLFYSGGNIEGEWKHAFSEGSAMTVRAYYDRYDTNNADVEKNLRVTDFEIEHHYRLSPRQELVWGAGYRRSDHDSLAGLPWYVPATQTNLFSAFAQDEISLVSDKLRLIAGTQVEHNTFTGVEVQPTVRLLWEPTHRYTLWGAVSRAVRTPSVGERVETTQFVDDERRNLGLIFPLVAHGNPALQSETLLGYEAGQRMQWNHCLSLDVSAFYNFFDQLSTLYIANLYVDPRGFVVMPTLFANQGSARTYGTDASANLTVTHNWKPSAGYSWLKLVPGAYDYALTLTEVRGPTDPQHQAQLHSNLDLTRTLQFDTSLYYTGSVAAYQIPSHWRADLRLGWRPTHKLEFSLAGQDLLSPDHAEFLYEVSGRTMQIRRGVTGNVTWSF
jgi:iron complex outermembrane receptor protein